MKTQCPSCKQDIQAEIGEHNLVRCSKCGAVFKMRKS